MPSANFTSCGRAVACERMNSTTSMGQILRENRGGVMLRAWVGRDDAARGEGGTDLGEDSLDREGIPARWRWSSTGGHSGHGRGPRSRTRGASASPKGRSQSAGRGGSGIDQMVQAPREFGRRQACSGREVYVLCRPPPQPDRGEPVGAVDMGQAADETLAIRRNWKMARRIDIPVAMP